MTSNQTFGEQLKVWRGRRRLSQLHLALEAEVSQRHISFLESGRAQPSRDMVLNLAEALELPLRERNRLLQSAGFAAVYGETPLEAENLAPIRAAFQRMLSQHMPFPAMLFDRTWSLLEANPTARALFGLTGVELPVNMLRMIAENPAITAVFENWSEIAHHVMDRLKLEEADSGGDPKLRELIALLGADPVFAQPAPVVRPGRTMICTRMRLGEDVISLFSTIAQFGTAQDITVNDLRVELFFPEDERTEAVLRGIAAQLVEV